MTDFRTTWDTYAESWKLEGRARKRAVFEQCLDIGCVYRDPLTEARGWGALIEYMLDFHRQIPGGHFRTQSFLVHHGCSLATWDMCDGSGQVVGTGASYGEYTAEGKLKVMTGFFEVTK